MNLVNQVRNLAVGKAGVGGEEWMEVVGLILVFLPEGTIRKLQMQAF